jgi:TusA-related sulfurtransferase
MLCPGPFAEVKAALDGMEAGQRIEVSADASEVGTLSKSVKEEGHRIVGTDELDDGRFRMVIERGA